MNDQPIPIHVNARKEGLSGLLQAYAELTKAKLSVLVVMSTGVAFVMASELGVDWLVLLWTILGTTLSAGAAAALNQLFEYKRDCAMHRTLGRPLPSGRISKVHAFVVGMALAYLGIFTLAIGANPAAAGISFLTILFYVLVYTPLKPKTTLNTFVGAFVGALPPLIGWVAATNALSASAWLLAGILFLWQIPHFLALAWKYREQYEQGGFYMLPSVDPSGELTGRASVLASLCLIPLCLLLTSVETTNSVFALCASLLNTWFVIVSFQFWKSPNNTTAMKMFIASIIYLPLLFLLMLLTRQYVTFQDITATIL
ncbi:MAG: heme o synthase [Phycisphaerales bacterium]|jgi:protoheme IX farnesyltransferase|nr:heme o synthase [Phycisphaerales bacterium]